MNRTTNKNAIHVYTVFFFKERFFFLDNFQEREEKRIFVLRQTKEVLSFFFPGGYSCNTRFFYTLKERFFRALASPGGLVNVCLSFTVTKVVLFSVYANTWYYFLYLFNRYLLFKLKRKVYLHFPCFLVAFLHGEERHQQPPAATSSHRPGIYHRRTGSQGDTSHVARRGVFIVNRVKIFCFNSKLSDCYSVLKGIQKRQSDFRPIAFIYFMYCPFYIRFLLVSLLKIKNL